MKRREALKGIGTAGVGASLSGCSGLLSGRCGPGTNEIGALAADVNATEETAASATRGDAETVRLTGEVQSVGADEVVIDDGTGTAELVTLFGDATARDVEDGDCTRASGTPVAPAADSDSDIRLLVEEIGPAEE